MKSLRYIKNFMKTLKNDLDIIMDERLEKYPNGLFSKKFIRYYTHYNVFICIPCSIINGIINGNYAFIEYYNNKIKKMNEQVKIIYGCYFYIVINLIHIFISYCMWITAPISIPLIVINSIFYY